MKVFSIVLYTALVFTGIIFSGCVSPQSQCLKKAEEGDAEAQGILGSIYLTGNNGQIDYPRAYYWLRHGAAGDDSVAGYYLGVIYQYGLGDVSPDQIRAVRHFKADYRDIHSKAKKGDIRYINILAEIYYYGRGLKADKDKAVKMFKYCARRRWPQAVENLGVIMLNDSQFRNLSKAKALLTEAATHKRPRAQFYLSEYYRRNGEEERSLEELKKASAGGYPPAMFKLAVNYRTNGTPGASSLFKAAADAGFAPAMMAMADSLTEKNQKLKWIKKAAEHSSVPAMLEYARLLSDDVTPDPAKEMIIYLLAAKIQPENKQIRKMISNLDKHTALYFPVKYCWEKISGGENILLSESEIQRVMSGFKAGIVDASKKLYQKRLKYNPLPFFMNNDWFLIHENSLPPVWAALLFKAIERHMKDNPGFWIGYGISAGQAGQGTAQAYAAFKLKELAGKYTNDADNATLHNLAALLKANALMLMNLDKEAYDCLFNNGKLKRVDMPFLINFINVWCQPLLKDKRKFSTATGIPGRKLGQFSLPEKKKFINLEYGQIIPETPKIKEPEVDYKRLKKAVKLQNMK
jgi:TPR repeat protein